MYHKRVLEEPNETLRAEMLQNFAIRISKIEECGLCTNRMNVVVNKEFFNQIFPTHESHIDHSWKLMGIENDDDQVTGAHNIYF